MRDDSPHTFRMMLWPLALFGAVFVPVGLALVYGVRGRAAGWDPLTRAYLVAVVRADWPVLLAAGLATPLLFALMVWYFTVRVGPAGLRGFDFWGRYQTLPWDRIGRTASASFAGLPFLRVWAAGGRRPVWLPLFLADWPRFVDALGEHAGADHPLTQAARDRLPAADRPPV